MKPCALFCMGAWGQRTTRGGGRLDAPRVAGPQSSVTGLAKDFLALSLAWMQ